MLYARFGRGICEKVPHSVQREALRLRPGHARQGRDGALLPHADLTDIVRNMKVANNASYNATFTYPRGGRHRVREGARQRRRAPAVALGEGSSRSTSNARSRGRRRREIRFERLVSSRAVRQASRSCAASRTTERAFTWNKVLVFNLGFDKQGGAGVHWVYYPDRGARLLPGRLVRQHLRHRPPEPLRRDRLPEGRGHRRRDATRQRASSTTSSARGSSSRARLVAEHAVVMDPAYVHITRASLAEHKRGSPHLQANGRLVDRAVRRLDLLLDRGQHRRSASPRIELELRPS
jgi:hypothetical protein